MVSESLTNTVVAGTVVMCSGSAFCTEETVVMCHGSAFCTEE